jgi:hypothetical protein
VVTNADAILQAQDGSQTKGNSDTCQAWVDSGWTFGDCKLIKIYDASPEAAGDVAYVTEYQGSGLNQSWKVFLLTTDGNESFWHIRLSASGGPGTYVGIKVVTALLTDDGQPEVIVGFSKVGTANVLAYDVVRRLSGQQPSVVVHRSLFKGSAQVTPAGRARLGQIIDYNAEYPSNEPVASPAYFTRTEIGFSNGAFRVIGSSHVAPSSVPPSDIG